MVVLQDSADIKAVSNRHLRTAGVRGQDNSEEKAPTYESLETHQIEQEAPRYSVSKDGPNNKIRRIVHIGESSATIVTNSGTSHASVAGLGEAQPLRHRGRGAGRRHYVLTLSDHKARTGVLKSPWPRSSQSRRRRPATLRIVSTAVRRVQRNLLRRGFTQAVSCCGYQAN